MCGRLQAHTTEHAFYVTKRKLRKAFGRKWRKIFTKIEKEPIGSGCIAQVILNVNMTKKQFYKYFLNELS